MESIREDRVKQESLGQRSPECLMCMETCNVRNNLAWLINKYIYFVTSDRKENTEKQR